MSSIKVVEVLKYLAVKISTRSFIMRFSNFLVRTMDSGRRNYSMFFLSVSALKANNEYFYDW